MLPLSSCPFVSWPLVTHLLSTSPLARCMRHPSPSCLCNTRGLHGTCLPIEALAWLFSGMRTPPLSVDTCVCCAHHLATQTFDRLSETTPIDSCALPCSHPTSCIVGLLSLQHCWILGACSTGHTVCNLCPQCTPRKCCTGMPVWSWCLMAKRTCRALKVRHDGDHAFRQLQGRVRCT